MVDRLDLARAWDEGKARQAYIEGDAKGFMGPVENGSRLAHLYANLPHLQVRGIYEAALIDGLTDGHGSAHNWTLPAIKDLFYGVDKAKMRTAGEPLPGPGPFTVYRGVAGIGNQRRVRGWSWTDDLPIACWFAMRAHRIFQQPDPAVYLATVTVDDVYAFTNDRNEREFIVRPDKPARMALGLAEMTEQASVELHRQREQFKAANAKAKDAAAA